MSFIELILSKIGGTQKPISQSKYLKIRLALFDNLNWIILEEIELGDK